MWWRDWNMSHRLDLMPPHRYMRIHVGQSRKLLVNRIRSGLVYHSPRTVCSAAIKLNIVSGKLEQVLLVGSRRKQRKPWTFWADILKSYCDVDSEWRKHRQSDRYYLKTSRETFLFSGLPFCPSLDQLGRSSPLVQHPISNWCTWRLKRATRPATEQLPLHPSKKFTVLSPFRYCCAAEKKTPQAVESHQIIWWPAFSRHSVD